MCWRVWIFTRNALGFSDNLLNNSPQITVGICAKNAEETIVECLENLIKCRYDRTKLEIIVVDGESIDKTPELAEKTLRDGQVNFRIESDHGKGLGFARQLVLDNAQGEYICWIDADSFVTENFIRNHAIYMCANAQGSHPVGLAMALILARNRNAIARLQMYDWLIPTLRALKKGRTPPATMAGTIAPIATLKEVGGFESRFKGSREDVNLIKRLQLHNRKVTVNPSAIIYHNMRGSWKELIEQMRWYGRSEPRLKFRELVMNTLVNFLAKAWSFKDFVNHTKDPICLFLPAFSLFKHLTYLVFYCSS